MGANTSVTLSAAQIAAAFTSGLTVLGTTGSFQGVFINNASNFSAASWNFSQWNPAENDAIVIQGTAGGDTLTGSSQNDFISGLNGSDVVNGGPVRILQGSPVREAPFLSSASIAARLRGLLRITIQ